jgi:hypothetical protein
MPARPGFLCVESSPASVASSSLRPPDLTLSDLLPPHCTVGVRPPTSTVPADLQVHHHPSIASSSLPPCDSHHPCTATVSPSPVAIVHLGKSGARAACV